LFLLKIHKGKLTKNPFFLFEFLVLQMDEETILVVPIIIQIIHLLKQM